MTKKTARVYTLDEMKEKSRKALDNPKLVELVKTAPLNKDGKVSLSLVYREAEKYVHEQTKDLQKTKELATATRFLAMLRRDFPEEFEKIVLEKELKKEVKTEVPKKLFHEIEFNFPSLGNISSVELITRESGSGHGITVERSMRFHSDAYNNRTGPRELGARFCMEIINSLIETADSPGDMSLMNDLTQLLEKKFGLKVKVCGNCKYYVPDNRQYVYSAPDGQCFYHVPDGYPGKKIDFSDTCERDWTPKEIPEKPSSA